MYTPTTCIELHSNYTNKHAVKIKHFVQNEDLSCPRYLPLYAVK